MLNTLKRLVMVKKIVKQYVQYKTAFDYIVNFNKYGEQQKINGQFDRNKRATDVTSMHHLTIDGLKNNFIRRCRLVISMIMFRTGKYFDKFYFEPFINIAVGMRATTTRVTPMLINIDIYGYSET